MYQYLHHDTLLRIVADLETAKLRADNNGDTAQQLEIHMHLKVVHAALRNSVSTNQLAAYAYCLPMLAAAHANRG